MEHVNGRSLRRKKKEKKKNKVEEIQLANLASVGSLASKNALLYIWSMFASVFRYSIAKTEIYVKENRIENSTGLFLLAVLFRQMFENLRVLFGPHCNISQPILTIMKLKIETNFDTLISNLKLHSQFDIVMTPW